jgi:peptidoglycan-N-acetylglucosamine deacetylase
VRRSLLNWFRCLALSSVLAGLQVTRAFAGCVDPDAGLPVSRVVEIDASNGPMFGSVTRQIHEPSFLKPKEVVLTFDDGPMPWVTKSILNTLDTFCTKATFFAVGRMALSYPATVKDILARGHTLGSHTHSHPFNMPRMNGDKARSEIERGLAEVATAAGQPIAPFFRFTGLADSARLLRYLQYRRIATFSVDVVSNDSYIHDRAKLVERTMAEVHRKHGGIILFHDIKTVTAKALPDILARLKAEGYSVVHITSRQPAEPLVAEMQAVSPKLARRLDEAQPALAVNGGIVTSSVPAAIAPANSKPSNSSPSVTALASPLRLRTVQPDVQGEVSEAKDLPKKPAAKRAPAIKTADDNSVWLTTSAEDATGPPVIVEPAEPEATTRGWIVDVKTREAAKPSSHAKP